MDLEDIVALQKEVISLQSTLAYERGEHSKALDMAKAKYAAQLDGIKAQIIRDKDSEIARLNGELAGLAEIAQLRANLYAFSDTFHIAAKRIVDTENPAEEAATLKSLADQLLTVVGLPPRDPSEFA